MRASIGWGGTRLFKREGDGATPIASLRLLYGFYRADRIPRPLTLLAMKPIQEAMGWCDDPDHASYNRLVKRPCVARHEMMKRGDALYDICIVLDWNIRPRKKMAGSAIFLHLKKGNDQPTQGCIALSLMDMRRFLAFADNQSVIDIV